MRDELLCGITGRTAQVPMEMEVIRQAFHTESRMRENSTLPLRYATASQSGSMRGRAQDAAGEFHGWRE